MKTYIFITEDIHPVGGMQEYVACKADYLQKKGWHVYILFNGSTSKECSNRFLNEFVQGGFFELSRIPFEWSYDIVLHTLCSIEDYLDINSDCSSIIIESHNDRCALWGELLASRINASHFCFICNEIFDGPGKKYKEYINFFDYKHKRKELTTISYESIPRLFHGYKSVEQSEIYVFKAATASVVQFVPTFSSNDLQIGKWNICYIGRAKKGYVPGIICEVAKFASAHKESTISFTIIGNMDIHKELIDSAFSVLPNIKINLMGDMVPIPQQIFRFFDVIIAGAGCALCSIQQMIPTIIPDASNFKCNGFYGFDTYNIFYAESPDIQCNYSDSLERFFVKKEIDKNALPKIEVSSPHREFDRQMEFINSSVSEKEYYVFPQKLYTSIFKLDNMKYKLKKRYKGVYSLYTQLKKR